MSYQTPIYTEQGGARLVVEPAGAAVIRPTAATAASGAATVHALAGVVTTEALATAQNGVYTLTLTNNRVAAADLVFASVANGSNTGGSPVLGRVQPGAGQLTILVHNLHATAVAFNGTLAIEFVVFKAA